METNETIKGRRLQPICRKLGLDFKEDGQWVKNGRYPSRWIVNGVTLFPEGAKKLRAYLEERDQKEQARRERLADVTLKRVRAEAKEKREQHLLEKIATAINERWILPPDEVSAFAKHANESGTGRVLRTTTKCSEPFTVKVYMALVAWVRHNKTEYERNLRENRDAAWRKAVLLRPDFAAGERWSTFSEEERCAYEEAREEARLECEKSRNELHASFTEEAVAWLAARETDLGKSERLEREKLLTAAAQKAA
jgi:hypothetical protein